jgi:hypothetical protein
MAKNETIRIRPLTLQADLDAFTALQSFEDYQPANPAYAGEAVASAHANLQAARDAELNAQNALSAARDTAAALEWEFHNLMLGVKDQVVARYGASSDQVQAMGLKKKSERKRPTPRKAAA